MTSPDSRPTVEDRLFHALGDPTRRRVLELIRAGALAVGEVAERLPVSQPAVSQHLRVLLEAGLVSVRADGRRRLYQLEGAGLTALRDWAERLWGDALDRYAASFTPAGEAGGDGEPGTGGDP